MNVKTRSTRTFFILPGLLSLAAGVNSFLPQGKIFTELPASPISKWQMALGGGGITLVLYGLLGYAGLRLWRNLGFPEILDPGITNRQRFFIPADVGCASGFILILLDLVFSRFNGIGRFMHPPFPTSLVASLSAGIGEELLFRLFFISFWTWLVGKVMLHGNYIDIIYWLVSSLSAVVFAASHLPTLMILLGASSPAQLSPTLILEVFIMNAVISLLAAYTFRKFGFLGAVGVHFWNDILWHMIWGLV